MHRTQWRLLCLLTAVAGLSGCPWGGKPQDPPPPPPPPPVTYTVGGTVSGLNGSITLANNGGDNRVLAASGTFTFATTLVTGAAYNVTVIAKPASQQCTVTNGSGSIASANISNVTVTCVNVTYTVGGTVTGLAGSGLVLQNNGADNLAQAADGAFTFATAIAGGSAYDVSVLTQPTTPAQTCTPANASGNVAANVTNVTITCVTNPPAGVTNIGPAGGTVSGHYGAQIIVPAGALATTVGIGLTRDSTNSPAFVVPDIDAIGATYELTPHGQSFTAPVTLRIPFDPTQLPNDEAPVLYKAEAGGAFTALPTTVNGNFLEATVTGFSWVIPGAQATKPRMVYAIQSTLVGSSLQLQLASYRINRTTGALTGPTSTALVGEDPISVVAHPSRRFVYMTNGGSTGGATTQNGIDPGSISTYQLSAINGNVAPTHSSTISLGNGVRPAYPVVHPSGKFLYVVTGRYDVTGGVVRMLTINGATGALSNPTPVADSGGAPATSIAFNRLGTLAYVTYIYAASTPFGNTFADQIKVYSVNLATGAFTGPIGSAPAGSNAWSIGVEVNDRFAYVASLSTNEIRAYALSTNGSITYMNGLTALSQPSSIALDAFGRFAFLGKQSSSLYLSLHSYAIGSGGTLTQANAVACPGNGCQGPIALTADPQGQFLYVSGGRAFAVNQTTGMLTSAGVTPNIYSSGGIGVGDPFRFAVTGTSPVWQNNCTHNCALSGTPYPQTGGGGGGGMTNPSPPTSHHLTVIQGGGWVGGVTSSPAGINISPLFPARDFIATFPAGSIVTLSATPPTGGTFDITWSGSCTGTDWDTTVSMTSDKQCTATFSPVTGR